MSQQPWRKYSPEFRREALERMKDCDSIAGLARELGIRRKWLYKWKDEAEAAAKNPVAARKRPSATDRLAKRVRELEALVGRQSEEIDFFKGALQKVEARRRGDGGSGETASTTRSEK